MITTDAVLAMIAEHLTSTDCDWKSREILMAVQHIMRSGGTKEPVAEMLRKAREMVSDPLPGLTAALDGVVSDVPLPTFSTTPRTIDGAVKLVIAQAFEQVAADLKKNATL